MKVSVIIPFYSNIKWLEEAIDSVLNQTYRNFEIIVINDGSPEDDEIFFKKYNSVILYFKIENGGPAKARNFGIEKVTGDYIAFLDSDDLWHDEKLAKQINYMMKYELIWSHTKYSVFDEVDNNSERVYSLINNEAFKGNVFPESLNRLNIATPCVMVKAEYLKENVFLRFSDEMRFGQDGYLWILLSVKNELGYIDETLSYVRRSGSNAVQRARIHLNVRANLNKYLLKDINNLYPDVEIPLLTKFIYNYCQVMSNLLDRIYGVENMRNKNAEFVAKVIYLPAYILFKIC